MQISNSIEFLCKLDQSNALILLVFIIRSIEKFITPKHDLQYLYRSGIMLEQQLSDKSHDANEYIIKYLKKVNQLSEGASFGEVALILSKPRTATVIAASDCELAVLRKDQFLNIMGKVQEIQINKVRIDK